MHSKRPQQSNDRNSTLTTASLPSIQNPTSLVPSTSSISRRANLDVSLVILSELIATGENACGAYMIRTLLAFSFVGYMISSLYNYGTDINFGFIVANAPIVIVIIIQPWNRIPLPGFPHQAQGHGAQAEQAAYDAFEGVDTYCAR